MRNHSVCDYFGSLRYAGALTHSCICTVCVKRVSDLQGWPGLLWGSSRAQNGFYVQIYRFVVIIFLTQFVIRGELTNRVALK